ncbi:hypothetical protein K6V25_14075 [Bacteroides salyersiae]|uniref:hypothetical protein n=1 Tax=Bacteroides salyersiae TaxID=291644 RepID=UPI001CCEC5CB|nr:hypothetical protein [Bacteroides salyersiae]UBD64064.1 hypothetical protein K6V25_14075 [Bacteroides salyersiae]
MAQISFRILGNPASSGGYTPLISKGEPLEADKVEIPYPNYTTDGECYGIKIYQDLVSYALYTNPIKVTSFAGNRSAALNIYLYIPKGYIVTLNGQEVSPKHILDRLSEEFYTQFMTMKGGSTSATWSYKTQAMEDFSKSKSLFVNIINEYTLQEKNQRSLVMSGHTSANVIVGSNNNISRLMLDPYYEQLSSYDRLIITENGESNENTISLIVPRPKTYKVYVNSCFIGQIKSDTQSITTNHQPLESYKIAENYSFTLQDVKEGKFADKVTIDDVNEIIYCVVTEKEKVAEWSVIIRVDGKPAGPTFKEKLYSTVYLENSGIIKRIELDKFKLVGTEIEKNWAFKNLDQEGYDVASNQDEQKRTILLSYTKKVVIQQPPAQSRFTQVDSNISKIEQNWISTIRFSLSDENNEYSQSDFDGTKLIIESGNQMIIISLFLKSNIKKKGIHIFEDEVDVEPFIFDKIFNNRIKVKSKNFIFECKTNRKEKAVQLIPEELSFFNRLKKKWWFKMFIILLMCLLSGVTGFLANNILMKYKKENIKISEFNATHNGYIQNGKVYKNNGKLFGYILKSNIYRGNNPDDEIIGVYDNKDKVLTIGNPATETIQTTQQPDTQVEPDVPSNNLPNPQALAEKSAEWMKKIKDGTIGFDEIEECINWATQNPNAPDATKIKTYCSKINSVKEFLLSISMNSPINDVIDGAKSLNSSCSGSDLTQYRIILQKFYLWGKNETEEQYNDKINRRIYDITESTITTFEQIKNM